MTSADDCAIIYDESGTPIGSTPIEHPEKYDWFAIHSQIKQQLADWSEPAGGWQGWPFGDSAHDS